MTANNSRVGFTRMSEGTIEDFKIITQNDQETAKDLPDRIVHHLRKMAEDDGAYKIDRLQHVLQTATRCERDGGDDDWVVGALIHDIGDVLAPFSHAEVAYAIISPFVREEVAWTIRHHGIFQMYYNVSLAPEQRMSREKYKDSAYFQTTIDFCENWDQCSFDPDYSTKSIDYFIPAIKRVFQRKPYSV